MLGFCAPGPCSLMLSALRMGDGIIGVFVGYNAPADEFSLSFQPAVHVERPGALLSLILLVRSEDISHCQKKNSSMDHDYGAWLGRSILVMITDSVTQTKTVASSLL